MKIEQLIETIQSDPRDKTKMTPEHIWQSIMALIGRLEGMLPQVETAQKVAADIGVKIHHENPGIALAWASVVHGARDAGKLDALRDAVLPLLPAGQPFGQSELDAVGDEIVMATVEGRTGDARRARTRGMRMALANGQSIKGQ